MTKKGNFYVYIKEQKFLVREPFLMPSPFGACFWRVVPKIG